MAHIIVCGLGQVGYRVADLLVRLGEEVTVITFGAKEVFLADLLSRGVRYIEGDARSERHLRDAGIDQADALLACTDNDLTNIEIALDARRLSADVRLVVRIFDPNLASTMDRSLGVQRVLAMSQLSAPAFAAAAFGAKLRGVLQLPNDRFVVSEISSENDGALSSVRQLPRWAALVHRTASGEIRLLPEMELAAQEGGTLDLAIEQDAFHSVILGGNPRPTPVSTLREKLAESVEAMRLFVRGIPPQLKLLSVIILGLACVSVAVFKFGMNLSLVDALYFVVTTLSTTGYGDITPRQEADWLKVYATLLMLLGSATIAVLYSIFTDYIVATRFDQVLGRQKVPAQEHVIVVGMGNVGFRTLLELRRLGEPVVGIDVDPNAEYRTLIPKEVPVIIGDARDEDILERSHLKTARAVIVATQNDAVNLSVALRVKSLAPEVRTVVRLFDADFARKVEAHLGIDVAMSASRVAAPTFVGAALYEHSELCYVHQDHFYAVCLNEDGHPLGGGRVQIIARSVEPA